MSISLLIGDINPLSFSGAKDLASAAMLNMKAGKEFSNFLGEPLSAIPPPFRSTAVQYSGGAPAWTPGLGEGSPLTFTLSAGVCGRIAVITDGDVLKYVDGFSQAVSTGLSTTAAADGAAKAIDVGDGQAFLALELDFQISGGVTGSYQQGIYGISTNDSAAATISVAFYKGCAPSTLLQDALKMAFEAFVLPLHEKTLERMAEGDYLHYNFSGNLQLGVGANIGYEHVFYAATTTQAIPHTADAVSLTASAAPAVQAGAQFCFQYDYCGTFEVLLWAGADRQAHLHLYRAAVQNTTVGANFGLTLTADATASVSVATDHLTALLTHSLPANLQPVFSGHVLPAAMGEVSKYADELNDKIAGWLNRASYQPAALDTAIGKSSSRFLLTEYAVDLKNPNYPAAWKLMIGGKFLLAMQTPGCGVSLQTGSGVEALFQKTAAVKLNLFGAFHASWTAATISNSSLVYAGDNVFHLVTVEGKDVLDVLNRTNKEMTTYFAAEADVSTAGSRVPPPKLHCILQAKGNPGFGKVIGGLIGRLSSGPGVNALAGQVTTTAQRANGTVTLHLIFGPDAYGALQASNLQHDRPDHEEPDAKNYAAFQSACAAAFDTQPADFESGGQALTYKLWREAWIASNDQWPAPEGSVPKRREHAGYLPAVQAQLDGALPSLGGDTGQGRLVFYALEAAARFMNLCDDLRALAASTATYTPGTWESFVEGLAAIVKNDLQTDFMPATVQALAALCGGVPAEVSGPVEGLPAGSSIGVTMRYGSAA